MKRKQVYHIFMDHDEKYDREWLEQTIQRMEEYQRRKREAERKAKEEEERIRQEFMERLKVIEEREAKRPINRLKRAVRNFIQSIDDLVTQLEELGNK